MEGIPFSASHYYLEWEMVANSPRLKYFRWPVMYGRQYLTTEPYLASESMLAEVRRASEACGRIYRKAVVLALKSRDLLALLGVPPHVVDVVRATRYDPAEPVTVVGRFDFAVRPSGSGWRVKLLEFNADTPSGVVEATEVNSLICEMYGFCNPNAKMPELVGVAFGAFVKKEYRNIVFTSLGWHEEDRGTALAEMDYSGLPARYVPLDELVVTSDGLYDDRGERVDLLYRLYPVEWFAEEKDGIRLLHLVAEGKLDVLNPLSAFVAQSKALQAVIWELVRTNSSYFTEKEREVVRTYFLPTYLEPDCLAGQPYVAKPAYEREGNGVGIYDEHGNLVAGSHYGGSDLVFQAYEELPQHRLRTLEGWFAGKLLVGAFLLAGRFGGVFLRVGGEVTDNLAYFVPCAVGRF